MKYNIDYHTTYRNTDYCGINYRMVLFFMITTRYNSHRDKRCGSEDKEHNDYGEEYIGYPKKGTIASEFEKDVDKTDNKEVNGKEIKTTETQSGVHKVEEIKDKDDGS